MILSIEPRKIDTNVPLDKKIKVTFQRDMNVNTLNTSTFQLEKNNGENVEGSVEYKDKIAYFTPDTPLEPDTTYQVTLVGDSEVEDGEGEGIQDILDNSLYGNYTWTFTTAKSETIKAPQLEEPYNESYLESNPIEFSWERPEGAVRFELQIARDRNFRTIVWPEDQSYISEEYITPDIEFKDGQYYWRVRAIDSRERPSKWSPIWTFSINTLKKGKVTNEDPEEPEVIDSGYAAPRELAEMFPDNHDSNIDLNLGAIVIKVLGEVDPDEVNENNFKITGKALGYADDDESHGDVEGTISVFYKDGLSHIVFQPEPVSE